MKDIKLHDKTFELFISAKEIEQIVKNVADKINNNGIEKPLFIAILNGSFLFIHMM